MPSCAAPAPAATPIVVAMDVAQLRPAMPRSVRCAVQPGEPSVDGATWCHWFMVNDPNGQDPDATRINPPIARDDATRAMPPVGADGQWTARASVPPPGSGPIWPTEPEEPDPYGGRSWLTPVIVSVIAFLLIAAVGVGVYLIYKRGQSAVTP